MSTNHNENPHLEVSSHEMTGHLIPAGDEDKTLVMSLCNKPAACKSCKAGVPVQTYKRYMTQWLPLEKNVSILVREVAK